MRPLFLALFLLLIFSCNRNTVSLQSTNAKGEVQTLANLNFRFSAAMVPDSLLNRWDSLPYISFEPAISGKFRWQQPDELVFSPSRPLAPATTYKAKLNDELLQFTKFNAIKSAKITFNTPEVRLEDLRVSWILQDQSRSVVPRADLYFNYPLSPDGLKDKITVEADGKPVAFSLVSVSDGQRISLNITELSKQDRDIEARVVLKKGIIPKGGTNATAGDIDKDFTIPSPFNLVINQVYAEHDGLTGTINISTSQQVSMDNISSFINIQPSARFSVEQSDDGFALKSDAFDPNKSYQVSIRKGLRGIVGGILQEQSDNNIAFGEIEPYIRFTAGKSVYLSSAGNRQVEMRIVNVPTIKVTVSKIYESNLLAAQQYGYYPRDRNDGDGEGDYYDDYGNNISFGDVIYEKEIETRTLPKSGSGRVFAFNIEDNLPNFKGIYHIKVRSKDNYWVSDSRFISVSDIGVIAKEGEDKLFVFANSIKTTAPMPGLNVVAYGNNNQVLGIGSTNDQGVAQIAYVRKEFAGFKPAMIIVKNENDFNFLPFNNTRVNTSRFETGGKRMNTSQLDAFIYAERDIYRPGEKINCSAVVRDRNWNVPGSLPVNFKFLLPNGKELRSFRKTLNEQGSTDAQIDLSSSSITGTYVLEMYTSNDVLLASQNFNIEEFVPDRIKVTTTIDREYFEAGQNGRLTINAVNFFGPPAANRKYELEVQIRAKDFTSKRYPAFDFSVRNQGVSFDKVYREGKTDENGNAAENYEVPAMFKNTGLLESVFYTTVFDETARPVSRIMRLPVFTQQNFFGIADDGFWYYPLNQQVKFPIIAIDKNERLLSGAKAQVKVIKHEYKTVLARAGSYFRYESQESDKVISDQQMIVNGDKTTFAFVPRSPGNYELRISVPNGTAYVSKKFYSYGSWGGDNSSFEVNTEGSIDIETDKTEYKPGDIAKILFKAPFSGSMLVTIEQDKVLSYQYINADKRSASLDIKINEQHLPNVFITATLIKPHTLSDIPLTVAHGFQNVRVADNGRKNNVQIVSAKAARSSGVQHVVVKASPNSFVTLAAVDNGVLQVTDFASPDPYKHFYAPRALQVNAYDMYPLLFPEIIGRSSSTGGSDEASLEKRMNPMPSKRVKILSFWSGIVKTQADGQAKFDIAIPKFSGEVRLMAVAYKGNSFGSAESTIKIADPIVISTALPRFLSPRDSLDVPVTVTNSTSTTIGATVTVKATGPLTVNGVSQQTINLAANGEARVHFRLTATDKMDIGKVVVQVQTAKDKYLDETSLGVRPAAGLQVLTGSGIASVGTTSIDAGKWDFIAGSEKMKLVVSQNALLESAAQIRYLVQYPYGCTEQVVSSAFPQLYYGDLAQKFSDANANDNANKNVIEAIRKIKLRQLYNGAVMLWDNEGTESWWTTIYAAHFLIEAKKVGFDVDNTLLSTMLNYINNKLRNRRTITYQYNRNQNKKIAPKEVAYSLYVLALASRANISVMNYYKANSALLSLDSKYLLGASYAIAGDKRKFSEMLPSYFAGEESVSETGGSFYSPIRDEAIALNALIEVDPDNKQIPAMARHLRDQLKSRSWYSTQESSFSLLALGKLASVEKQSNVTATIKINGQAVAKFSGEEISYVSDKIGLKTLQIETSGKGRLYYYWQAEGISASGKYQEEDSYIKVRRQFFDRFGKVISNNTFTQNDLVIVRVTLERAFSGDVENIVITDILPAGFEIENPRTKEIPGMEWIKDGAVPTALDVRDDRIHLFVDLTSARQVYYYAVRAVSPGAFTMGPVSADAMYNGEYHSYNGGGTVKIME